MDETTFRNANFRAQALDQAIRVCGPNATPADVLKAAADFAAFITDSGRVRMMGQLPAIVSFGTLDSEEVPRTALEAEHHKALGRHTEPAGSGGYRYGEDSVTKVV